MPKGSVASMACPRPMPTAKSPASLRVAFSTPVLPRPASLCAAAGCFCTSWRTSRSSSHRRLRTVAFGLGSKRPTGFWTRAFPRHRAPGCHPLAKQSCSISIRPFSRIFVGCVPRSETKRLPLLFLNGRKEGGDGSCDLDSRLTPAAPTGGGEQSIHVDIRAALHLVDGRRVSRLLAPSQPQGRGDQLPHPVPRRPVLGHDRDRDLPRPQRLPQLPSLWDVERAASRRLRRFVARHGALRRRWCP